MKIVNPQATKSAFSEREINILQLVAAGSACKEIAQRLFLSETTIRRMLSQAFNKLGAHNSSEAVANASGIAAETVLANNWWL